MQRLTEGAHQTSDNLTVADIAYSWHDSFSWTTVCGAKDGYYLLYGGVLVV